MYPNQLDAAWYKGKGHWSDVSDENWFDCLNFNYLKKWLNDLMESEDFKSIMKKYTVWNSNQIPIYTNFNSN